MRRCISKGLGIAAVLALGVAPPAFAQPGPPASAPPHVAAGRVKPAVATAPHSGHAELSVSVGRAKAWVGQAIPMSVTARFRAIDGATLEGAPELESDAVFTSSLPNQPRQSTQNVAGEPVLVATWTGTVTPSSAGPLLLKVSLPVKVRFHDAPRVEQPSPDEDQSEDPFQDMMNLDPFDPGSMDRIFRSMRRSLPMAFGEAVLGQAHDEAMTLKAAARSLDVQPLPEAGKPANFSGAVGKFDLSASLSAQAARVNEPVTLSITVEGDGDLDRVALSGLQTSPDFKAYPLTPKAPPMPGKLSNRRSFEQVLIPIHGGLLEIPSLKLSAFDPTAGHYTEVKTAPLRIDVEGAASLPPTSSPAAPALAGDTPRSALPAEEESPKLSPPSPRELLEAPARLALELAPVLLVMLAAFGARLLKRRDPETALRSELRRRAKQGSASAFFDAARRLITVHFARRWQMSEAAVTPDVLQAKLGERAEPLVTAMTTAEALRFGRRSLETTELPVLCQCIELSLKEVP